MPTTISGDTGVIFPDATTQSTAVSVTTPFSVNALPATGAELRLPEATANGVNYVAVKAPDLLAGNVTWTLPAADGTSGQFLQTNGSGQLAFSGINSPLAVVGNSTAGAEIRLPEDTDNGSNYVALKAADNLAANLTFTLPSADGTNGQVLRTNGSGVLSFATLSSGMSLVETKAATGTEVVFTGLTGSRYLVIFNNVQASGGVSQILIQWGYGVGPTYQASGYNYQYQQLSGTTFNNYGWYSNGDGRILAFSYSVSSPISANIFMTGVGTTRPSTIGLGQDTNNYMTLISQTNVSAADVVNSFRIYGTTFTAGSISLYALA